MDTPTVAGPRVTLRAPEPRDIDARLEAGRDPDFVRGFGDPADSAGSLTLEQAEGWYRRACGSGNEWVIEVDGEAVGSARLEAHGHATAAARYAIGIWRADLRGRGLGEEVTRLVLRHAFGALGLHRVELRVLARNQAAVRCYRKCGFQVEGRLREVLFEGGVWHDELHMGVLEHEFDPP